MRGFLGWAATTAGPDGAPRRATPFAVAAPLLACCRLAVSGQQVPLSPLLLALCPLTFALTGDAWARILAALGGAGLFDAPLVSSDYLLEALAALAIADASALEVGAGDLLPVEGVSPQAAVAAQAAAPARRGGAGRGSAPARLARAAVPVRPALEADADFFAHTTLGLLEDPVPDAALPWLGGLRSPSLKYSLISSVATS